MFFLPIHLESKILLFLLVNVTKLHACIKLHVPVHTYLPIIKNVTNYVFVDFLYMA